ncbi:MAG: LPXTG cell wall anchor domain-containing protein, partial [Parasporobacterium sp.]|nr:LPXTG cell wall anchor domain-containing protein [Parasporobacterium sp.]
AVAEAVKTNEIPSTGDNNMMTMWLALAAIALAAGTGAVVYKKESR